MSKCKKLYDCLGVEPNASDVDIKRAFKNKALKLHPDKTNNDPKSSELFKEATEAYEVLSDPERRKTYDMYGVTEDAGMMGGGGGGVDLNDILGNMFGGASGFAHMFGMHQQHHQQQQQQQQRARKADSASIAIQLSDVYDGAVKHIVIDMPDCCKDCRGEGVLDPLNDIISCARCGGAGITMNQIGPFMAQSTCMSCFGKGRMIRPGKACSGCNGEKVVSCKKTFDVRLPRGIPNGHTHTIKEKGSYQRDDKTYNDIKLTFMYAIPEGVTIDSESTIHVRLKISLTEILCGFKKVVSPWGKNIRFTSATYIDPTSTTTFVGSGLPKYKKESFGDLVLHYDVMFPTTKDFAKYTPIFLKALKLGGDINVDERIDEGSDKIEYDLVVR